MILDRWDTPFAEHVLPSVGIISGMSLEEFLFTVAPSGINKYPKYLVDVTAAAMKWYDESVAPPSRWSPFQAEEKLCSYVCLESPWLEQFKELEGSVKSNYGTLRHFILWGGDSIVEFLAAEEPKIQLVEGPREKLTYRI